MSLIRVPGCYGGAAMDQRGSGPPQDVGKAADDGEGDRGLESRGMNDGLRVLSMLIAGCLFYGFLGWLGDRLLGTSLLMPFGIVVGLGLAVYMVAKRYGTSGMPLRSPRGGGSR